MTVHLHSAGANCCLLDPSLLCTENTCFPSTLPSLRVHWIVLLSSDRNLLLLPNRNSWEYSAFKSLSCWYLSWAITQWNKQTEWMDPLRATYGNKKSFHVLLNVSLVLELTVMFSIDVSCEESVMVLSQERAKEKHVQKTCSALKLLCNSKQHLATNFAKVCWCEQPHWNANGSFFV